MRVSAEAGFYDGLLSQEEFERLVQATPFRREQRQHVVSSVRSLVEIGLQEAGLPPIEVPTEYVAAVISVFVHPGNFLTVGSWLASDYSKNFDSIVNNQFEEVRASALSAWANEMWAHPRSAQVKQVLESRLSVKMSTDYAKDTPEAQPQESKV